MMKLGTRWAAHSQPPASVPAAIATAVAAFEKEHLEESGYWTLTWLENHPYAEWDAGWDLTVDDAGNTIARPFDD